MYGLLIAYLITWPAHWMMVKAGGKYGATGVHAGDGRPAKSLGARFGLPAVMALVGATFLVLPVWLVDTNNGELMHPMAWPETSAGSPAGVAATVWDPPENPRHLDGAMEIVQSFEARKATASQAGIVHTAFGGTQDVWGILGPPAKRGLPILPDGLTQEPAQLLGQPAFMAPVDSSPISR